MLKLSRLDLQMRIPPVYPENSIPVEPSNLTIQLSYSDLLTTFISVGTAIFYPSTVQLTNFSIVNKFDYSNPLMGTYIHPKTLKHSSHISIQFIGVQM